MWDIGTGTLVRSFPLGHSGPVTKLLGLGSLLLVSASGDGTLRIWDHSANAQVHCIDVGSPITYMTLYGESLVVVAQNKTIYIYN